jgi:hypothetical protein
MLGERYSQKGGSRASPEEVVCEEGEDMHITATFKCTLPPHSYGLIINSH